MSEQQPPTLSSEGLTPIEPDPAPTSDGPGIAYRIVWSLSILSLACLVAGSILAYADHPTEAAMLLTSGTSTLGVLGGLLAKVH